MSVEGWGYVLMVLFIASALGLARIVKVVVGRLAVKYKWVATVFGNPAVPVVVQLSRVDEILLDTACISREVLLRQDRILGYQASILEELRGLNERLDGLNTVLLQGAFGGP